MFNMICPRVYQRLRERSGLSQGQLGAAIGGNRHSVHKFENGKTRPDAAQEARMLEITKCSKLEFVEMVCEELGELIDAPVEIRRNREGYEPTSLIGRAYRLFAWPGRIPAALLLVLKRKLTAIRMQAMLFEFLNADLEELIQSCHDEMERDTNEKT